MKRAQLERAAGQMLVVGFEGDGAEPPEEIAEALKAGAIGGVILFSRNIRNLEQVVALNRRIHQLADGQEHPPFVAIDQEGGRVMRIRDGVTPIPPMGEIGEGRDPGYVADVSQVIASELQTLGFNLNFAPVLDVDTNPDNPIIGDRAFGGDPGWVGRAGGAYLYGHNVAGVVPCGKHFPGHGDTRSDSHKELPVLMHGPDRLEEVELQPFRTAVGAGIPMVMTAHILMPSIDTVHPATFSPKILDGILREELGFEGVVVTDDLEMAAVAERYTVEEMIDLGLETSVDIFLICHTADKWQRAHQRLVEAGMADEQVAERIAESAERVEQLKAEFFAHRTRPWTPAEAWPDRLAGEAHRQKLQREG